MKRWLFNIAAAVSLVMCLGSAILWAVSYGEQYTLFGHGVTSHLGLSVCSINRGSVYLGLEVRTAPDFWIRMEHGPSTRSVHSFERSWAGFGYIGEPSDLYVAVFPLWVTLLVLGLLAWWFHRSAGSFKNDIGFCRNCGYDLRATPDRCPECGTVPAASKGAAA